MLTAGLIGGGIGLLAGLLGAGLQSATGLATGLYGANASERSNERNLEESKRQFDANMAWQREQFKTMIEMANTAHQREVDDLRAAGLNPVLSATGGSGAAGVSSVGSVSPTAHASDLDLSGSLKMISDSLSSAADQALKSTELGVRTADADSQMALREAQAAEALSNAAKNRALTPAMRADFLARANASAAGAHYHNTLADSAKAMTPYQIQALQSQILKNQTDAAGVRIENRFRANKLSQEVQTSAAMEKYLLNRTSTDWIHAGADVVKALRGAAPGFNVYNYGDDFGAAPFDFEMRNGKMQPVRPMQPRMNRPIRGFLK